MARVTIADVAKEAGVSTMTVSRVLNNKAEISEATRLRVQKTIERLNYRPSAVARSLTMRRTHTLGLMVPDITNPFFPDIVRGAEDVAVREGYSLILCNTVESLEREKMALKVLEEKRVDGIVVCSARLPEAQLLPLLAGHPAVVLVNRTLSRCSTGTVRVDDYAGTAQAVRYLLSRGRRRIGLLAGPTYAFSAALRQQGFVDTLNAAGQPVRPEHIVSCSPDEAGGYEGAKVLLEKCPELDGLVCYNDLVAVGALNACAELGVRVPDEVAVVGCDDIRLASLVQPSLTTLGVSKYDLGSSAVRMLLKHLQHKEDMTEIILKPELIVRDSAP